MGITYKFSVVKGVQAQREYYIAMLPLGTLSKIFRNERDYIAPEFRAQRCINEARIPEIRDYILNNRRNYVFSALSASIDGSMKFIPSELDESIGILEVDMEAVFLINDGQHRKAAIEAALAEAPDLARETISIVFFEDAGLERSQQMFADLNKHAVKSTMSLSTLYDSRDDLANAVKAVVSKVAFLAKYAKLVMCGNPTKITGFFYDSHHKSRELYNAMHIDGRDSSRVDQQFIDTIIDMFGEDSDVFRVRVAGEFPKAMPDSR